MLKKLLTYLPFVLLLVIAGAAISFSQKQQREAAFERVIITINSDSAGNQLLVDEDILQILEKHGDTIGKKIQDFDLMRTEQLIADNPFVSAAESYFDMHNTLHIQVEQRVPFVRIMGQSGDFYIDTTGQLVPLSPHFAPRVIVASGEIAQAYRKNYNLFAPQNDTVPTEHSILQDIFRLNQAIASNELLQASIEQIYVTHGNEFFLISKIGPAKIEFGSIENYKQKLQNLIAFYNSKKAQENWNQYRAINVKYNNQVIGIKK
ncbi:MAG: hypothetical protein LBU90_00760 [Bacteroidales bacterium]|jgi:cell division protein FtsQ|nr:hypothetical protein [Bacteroidales bacterium]